MWRIHSKLWDGLADRSGTWPDASTALRSRELWLEASKESGIWLSPCGSIHLAHHDDEWQVLQEFADRAPGLGFECELLSADQARTRTPGANAERLKGGLFSPTEMCVNPPATIRALPAWLSSRYQVQFRFQTVVVGVDGNRVVTSPACAESSQAFDHVYICSGADIRTLYAEHLGDRGLKICKLQMMKTVPQPSGWRLGTHLASGLTLRHYECFKVCPSLAALRSRIAADTPELDFYGIHVMMSQNEIARSFLVIRMSMTTMSNHSTKN